jgi:hypothetical protein
VERSFAGKILIWLGWKPSFRTQLFNWNRKLGYSIYRQLCQFTRFWKDSDFWLKRYEFNDTFSHEVGYGPKNEMIITLKEIWYNLQSCTNRPQCGTRVMSLFLSWWRFFLPCQMNEWFWTHSSLDLLLFILGNLIKNNCNRYLIQYQCLRTSTNTNCKQFLSSAKSKERKANKFIWTETETLFHDCTSC